MALDQVQLEKLQARATVRRVLFWTAVVTTVLGALYLLGLVGKLLVDGTVHSVSSQGVEIISATVGLLWDVALLILFAALRRQVPRRRRLFAELALIFMTLVCAMSSVNWFLQLTVTPNLEQAGQPALAALLDVHSRASLAYAMEHLGWGLFYGLAAIFAAVSLAGSRLETWIRALLLASGALSLVHFAGVAVSNPLLSDLGYVAWALLLPASTALLAVRFRKQDRLRA